MKFSMKMSPNYRSTGSSIHRTQTCQPIGAAISLLFHLFLGFLGPLEALRLRAS
jgi:hypothetical protein